MGRPEDSRVKIPALVHFTRLGYTYMSIIITIFICQLKIKNVT